MTTIAIIALALTAIMAFILAVLAIIVIALAYGLSRITNLVKTLTTGPTAAANETMSAFIRTMENHHRDRLTADPTNADTIAVLDMFNTHHRTMAELRDQAAKDAREQTEAAVGRKKNRSN